VNSNLHAHIRTHRGDKPYTCDICGNGFSQNGSFQTHTRIHTSDTSNKCCIGCMYSNGVSVHCKLPFSLNLLQHTSHL
jgi:uncharacterized Zn-finger protein